MSGVEDHPRWHRHNRAGPRCAVMVEVTVYPAPDLSAGGEKGEVGYATMQHSTHSHPNSIPTLPTHSSCRPTHIISCCPLETARCIVSHRYLGNYLISLDDDEPSFDKAILSIYMQSAGLSGCGLEYPALGQQGSFMCPVCHKLTQ